MSNKIELRGEDFYIKTLLAEDVTEKYVGWLNDPEVNQFLEVRFSKSTIESVKEWVSQFDIENKYLFGIYTILEDNHIGNITLYVNKDHQTAVKGYLIGEKQYWGKGAAEEANSLLIQYAFKVLKLRKINGSCYINNIGAIWNYKRLSYKKEGHKKKQVLFKDCFIDVVDYAIFPEDWYAHCKKRGKKFNF